MECSKCGFENPDKAKFCIECGTPIEFLCPNCGSETSASGKFCMECGFKLEPSRKSSHRELTFDEKIDKIQRYLPKGVTEKILSQRGKIEGERKQVTVMFCDLEGFTSLVENLGPERAYNIMDHVYEILIHKVHNYGGTVNEMTGDGVMALFGAPIALEDAPQRAIRSSMSIHKELTRFNEKQNKMILPLLKMRIGINTGPVIVGALGNDLRIEFKAVGDTINVASRLEGLAESGATYVSEETFNLTSGLFRFESLGEMEIKGKKDPIRIYRVITTSSRRTRFDVSAERGLTPFVGRERELEILLEGFERSKAGRGQVLSIISEAGVGKSRLLYEFRKKVSNENATFFEGKCLSYSQEVAYHPIIDILESSFEIKETDSEIDISEKLKKTLNIVTADELSTLPYLLEILSNKEAVINQASMSPEAKRYRIREALRHVVIKSSEIRPLIIVVEDLHWVDKSSEEVIIDLIEHTPGASIFLLLAYRPEFVPSWGMKSYISNVTLNRLPNQDSMFMVKYLFGTEEISADFNIECA